MADHFGRDDVRRFIDLLEQMGGKKLKDSTPGEGREAFRTLAQLADLPPEPLPAIEDLACPGPAGDIALRYYEPRDRRRASPAILFFHGGGFVIGDLDSHHSFCTKMARELELPLVSVDYRLAPENRYPAAPEDCEAAARWLAASPERLGLDVTGLILCGDSAGGNLSAVTARSLRDNPANVPVIAQFLLYPVVDADGNYQSIRDFADGFLLTVDDMVWFDAHYRAKPGDERYDILALDHEGMPPTVLVTAGLDPLRDQGREFAERLREAGCDVRHYEAEGNVHGFVQLRAGIPSSQGDVAEILDLMKQSLKANIPEREAGS